MDQQLQVFIMVAEKQNFSRAAEELHMTQPAVSQYIRTFEGNLGVRLLERTNKYVRLNKAGEIVYHHAKEIVGSYTRMQNLLDELTNKVRGPLSIGASYTFGEYVLPHVLAEMKAVYPDVQPTVKIDNTERIVELVRAHQLDIGIIEGHVKEEKYLEIEEFAEDRMVIIALPNNGLDGGDGEVELEELEEQAWILREEGSGTREAGEKIFKELGIYPKNIMTFSSTQSVKEAVRAGLGISLLSELAVARELKSGDLKIFDVNGLQFSRQFYIVLGSSFRTKVLEEFVGLLKAKGKQLY
ncbi:selenium metabolism-associated LysR family transcriptional regulator [Bacillus sp. JJ1533]|uniref:selenium metabolism-associated LysR family transcriptional regulator n=1 Tax=Bacillus sp. JJ1533 TaxID=3122959 RepID=UPI002FFF123A